MISKNTLKSLEDPERSSPFTEFSYKLEAYDFYHSAKNRLPASDGRHDQQGIIIEA
jgi:hypothetical protein